MIKKFTQLLAIVLLLEAPLMAMNEKDLELEKDRRSLVWKTPPIRDRTLSETEDSVWGAALCVLGGLGLGSESLGLGGLLMCCGGALCCRAWEDQVENYLQDYLWDSTGTAINRMKKIYIQEKGKKND